jgi:hypothetical protein
MSTALLAALALAASPLPEPGQAAPSASQPPPAQTVPAPPRPLTSTELQAMNGRAGVTVVVASGQLLQATNSGNTVRADTIGSGAITVGANAFTGFSGIGNFVMNTGHNNNLQGAITINIATVGSVP